MKTMRQNTQGKSWSQKRKKHKLRKNAEIKTGNAKKEGSAIKEALGGFICKIDDTNDILDKHWWGPDIHIEGVDNVHLSHILARSGQSDTFCCTRCAARGCPGKQLRKLNAECPGEHGKGQEWLLRKLRAGEKPNDAKKDQKPNRRYSG